MHRSTVLNEVTIQWLFVSLDTVTSLNDDTTSLAASKALAINLVFRGLGSRLPISVQTTFFVLKLTYGSLLPSF